MTSNIKIIKYQKISIDTIKSQQIQTNINAYKQISSNKTTINKYSQISQNSNTYKQLRTHMNKQQQILTNPKKYKQLIRNAIHKPTDCNTFNLKPFSLSLSLSLPWYYYEKPRFYKEIVFFCCAKCGGSIWVRFWFSKSKNKVVGGFLITMRNPSPAMVGQYSPLKTILVFLGYLNSSMADPQIIKHDNTNDFLESPFPSFLYVGYSLYRRRTPYLCEYI
jgi:hypothetical protein